MAPASFVGATESAWGESSRESNNVACGHFNIFLYKYYLPRHPDLAEKLFGSTLENLESNDVDYNNIALEKRKFLDYKVFNEFGEYLPKYAVNRVDKKSKLAYESGVRYFSSMITRLNNDLREINGGKDHLDPAGTNKIRKGMHNLFVQDAIRNHVPLSKSHSDASRNDLIAIILLCFWTANIKLAQFAFFLGSLYQLSGRVAEAATVPYKCVSMYQPDEFRLAGSPNSDKIAEVALWRPKTTSRSELSIFNDRDSFIIDWYFLMCYHMIMAEEMSDQLFPDFAQRASNSNNRNSTGDNNNEQDPDDDNSDNGEEEIRNKKTRDNVSRYFTDTFNKIVRIFDVLNSKRELYEGRERPVPVTSKFVHDFNVTVNRDITSHSAKRCAVNTALLDPILSTILICLRAGWIMKAVHTVFDYVGYNKSHDRKVARSLSMWRVSGSDPNQCTAGRPPSLKALQSDAEEYDKAVCTMKCLFVDYENIEGANNLDLQNVLFATVLKNLESFLVLLKEHPDHGFGETDNECFHNHRFLQKLFNGAANANINNPVETLLRWGRLIDADFHRRNFMFVSMESLFRVLPIDELGQTFTADSRSLYDHFNDSSRAFQQQHTDMFLLNQKVDAMNRLKEEELTNQRKLTEQNQILIQQNQILINLLQQKNGQQILNLAVHGQGQGANVGNSDQDAVTATATATARPILVLPDLTDLTVTSIFLSWHRKEYFKLPVKSNKKKDRNTRNVIKTAIEYFTLFLENHIDPLPSDAHPGRPGVSRSEWNKQLESKTKTAWEKVLELYKRTSPEQSQKKRRKRQIDRVTTFKKFMDNLDHEEWPIGPVGESVFQPTYMEKMKTRDVLVEAQLLRRQEEPTSADDNNQNQTSDQNDTSEDVPDAE